MKTQSIFRTGLAATLLASSLLLTNCQPTNGEKGDPGPQGEQGIQGPKGDPGPQGAVGTANVIQVTWTKASNRTNPYENVYSLPSGVTTKDAMVVAYVDAAGNTPSNARIAIPSFLDYAWIPYTQHAFYSLSIYSNSISVSGFDEKGSRRINLYDFSMRAVIIPAAVVKSGRFAAGFFDNYEAVQKAFNLPD